MWVSINHSVRHSIVYPSVIRYVHQCRKQSRKVKHWSEYYRQVLSKMGETDPGHPLSAK